MKKEDIKALSIEELKTKIAEEKAAMDKLKFAHAISSIENPMQIRTARKLVAQLSTELSLKTKEA